jgi:hypothetical protein
MTVKIEKQGRKFKKGKKEKLSVKPTILADFGIGSGKRVPRPFAC